MSDGMHHLSVRKRLYKNTEPIPSPDVFKRRLDKAMYVVGLAGPVALFPQVLEVFTTHNVSSLSIWTWLTLGVINVLWTLYGWLHREYPILISSGAMAVLQFSIVAAILIYGMSL